MSETKHQMKLRHKAELKELKESFTGKKDKGTNKKFKDEEKEMLKRHEMELKSLHSKSNGELLLENPGEVNGTQKGHSISINDSPQVQTDTAQSSILPSRLMPTEQQQPSRTAHKKMKKQQKEQERLNEIKREIDKLPDDERTIENRLFDSKLSAINKQISSVLSDGHCLFRAVSEQIKLVNGKVKSNSDGTDHISLRKMAVKYIRSHKDDFLPFLTDKDGNTLSADRFVDYCDSMSVTDGEVEWGGHPETVALAKVLNKRIRIYSAKGKTITVEPDNYVNNNESDDLHLSFHEHYYGLGNHYNSVIDRQQNIYEE